MDKPAKVFTYEQAMKHFLFDNKYNIDLYPTIVTDGITHHEAELMVKF